MASGGPGGFAGGVGGLGGATAGKAGTPAATLDANLNRYIDATDQVRRMPVAVILLVDQMYLQDALAAYSNSTLRFQITQYHWSRFRGTLDMPGVPGGVGAGPGGSSEPPGGDGGDSGTLQLGGPPGGPGGSGGRPGMMPGMVPGGSSGSYPGGSSGMYGSGGSSAGVSEAQAASGLVELTIYGVVTLYEKFDDGTTPAAPATPAPAPDAPKP